MQTVHFAFQMKILILIFRLLKQEKIILWENNDNGLDIDKCEGLISIVMIIIFYEQIIINNILKDVIM